MTARPELSGRVVIVTGGAGLLGREYGRALVEAGAHVLIADIDPDGATAVAEGLRGGPGIALSVPVDVADETSVRKLVRTALESFGRIDGLVNNAALDPKVQGDGSVRLASTFESFPLDEWNRALAVNLTGMFLCAREVAPTMLAQKSGAIVNVSSTYGVVGPDQRLYESDAPGAPRAVKPVSYSVTKSAVIGLTRYLAAYWAGSGIRVNTLTPGGVRNGQDPEFVERYSTRATLGRMARPDEYSGAILFLLSGASSYMTGANLVVDGGWTAW